LSCATSDGLKKTRLRTWLAGREIFFSRFDTIHECGRQTYGYTDGYRPTASGTALNDAYAASRDKNGPCNDHLPQNIDDPHPRTALPPYVTIGWRRGVISALNSLVSRCVAQ